MNSDLPEIRFSTDPNNAHFHDVFRAWCLNEWGHIDAFLEDRLGAILPQPIFATQAGVLVGGLAFTRAIPNHGIDYELWINAIVVAPTHRRRGVASGLIRAAEKVITGSSSKRLYALTDVPALYSKLGWETVETGTDGSVMCLC